MEYLLKFDNLQRVLERFAKDIAATYKGKITKDGKTASGALEQSADSGRVVRVNQGRFEITFDLESYWKYVERGSQGALGSFPGALGKVHWPPTEAILNWIQIKPILPRPDSRGRIPSPQQLAFLIGRKIHDYGIEPSPMLTETMDTLTPVYERQIEEAIAQDTEVYLSNILFREAFSGFTR